MAACNTALLIEGEGRGRVGEALVAVIRESGLGVAEFECERSEFPHSSALPKVEKVRAIKATYSSTVVNLDESDDIVFSEVEPYDYVNRSDCLNELQTLLSSVG